MSFRIVVAGILAIPSFLVTIATIPIVAILSIPSMVLLLSRKFPPFTVVQEKTLTNSTSTSTSTSTTTNSTINNNKGDRNDGSNDIGTTITTTTTATIIKKKKQIVITGGSSGIGLGIAKEAARRHIEDEIDTIYILARNIDKLENAKHAILEELSVRSSDSKKVVTKTKNETTTPTATTKAATMNLSKSSSLVVETISVDVTDSVALERVAKQIMTSTTDTISSTIITTTHLFCCAGEPYPMYLEDVTSEMYAKAVATNQLGSIYTATAFLPYMKESTLSSTSTCKDNSNCGGGGGGTITFCSSGCGLIGVFGYAAYCPTKFAIRGFAECLYMELLEYPTIHIQVAFPADTDTPGFVVENQTKPVETALISESAGLSSPSTVGTQLYCAAVFVSATSVPKFYVYTNLEMFLVGTVCYGFAPVTTLFDAIVQVSCMNLIRFIAIFTVCDWRNIIYNYKNKTKKEQQCIETKLFPDRKKQEEQQGTSNKVNDQQN